MQGEIISYEEYQLVIEYRRLKPEVRRALLQIVDELDRIESVQVPDDID